MNNPIRSFKDLIVWQKAFQLCLDVYRLSAGFPKDERFGMTLELRKTARSILYNIAEGHQRRSTLEYIHFLSIAAGSRAELETQLLLASSLGYLSKEQSEGLLSLSAEIAKLLAALIRSLRDKTAERQP